MIPWWDNTSRNAQVRRTVKRWHGAYRPDTYSQHRRRILLALTLKRVHGWSYRKAAKRAGYRSHTSIQFLLALYETMRPRTGHGHGSRASLQAWCATRWPWPFAHNRSVSSLPRPTPPAQQVGGLGGATGCQQAVDTGRAPPMQGEDFIKEGMALVDEIVAALSKGYEA